MIRQIAARHGRLAGQFGGYLIVGGVAFLFDFGTLYALTELAGISYLVSAAVAFIIGLNVNYALAKLFVFKGSKIEDIRKEYVFVAIISLTGLLLNQLLIWSLTELAGIYYLMSKVVSAAIILVYNFSLRKLYLFQ